MNMPANITSGTPLTSLQVKSIPLAVTIGGDAADVRTRVEAPGKAAAAWQDDDEFILLTELLGAQPQADWYVEIMKERATGSISQAAASARVLHRAWAEAMEEDQPLSDADAEHIEDDETEDEDA